MFPLKRSTFLANKYDLYFYDYNFKYLDDIIMAKNLLVKISYIIIYLKILKIKLKNKYVILQVKKRQIKSNGFKK